MNRILAIAIAAAVVIGGGAYWYSTQSQTTGVSLGSASAEDAQAVDTSIISEMSLGNPEAKVTVVEYASFTCPHCKNFHATVFPDLKKDYIDSGKINFIYREVYFDRFGLWAGMLARCGGDMRYFGISDILYNTQSEWLAGGDPVAVTENLKKIGRTAGMSDETVNACMNDADTAKAMVALFQKNSEADGIKSTPSFVINGTNYSNMSYPEFAAILEEKLAE